MPSPPSTRPSDARGRRSSAFVREDLGRASGSALLVDHRCRFGSWRSSRPSFAYVIWLVSRVINVETKIAEELGKARRNREQACTAAVSVPVFGSACGPARPAHLGG